jgi:hypothetical protein
MIFKSKQRNYGWTTVNLGLVNALIFFIKNQIVKNNRNVKNAI